MTDTQAQLLEALASPNAWPHGTDAIRVVETHISWVVLTGRFAYKIKKSLKLPFLDFSTLALRERFCRDELRLNRRFAPDLYLDVIPIGGNAAQPRVGATPAIEYAVKMRQFPSEATADRLLGASDLGADELIAFADRIAAFHAALAPAESNGSQATMVSNLEEVEAALGRHEPRVDALGRLLRERIATLAPDFAARRAAGAIRECHGDLHLGNIVRIDGTLTPFDCLEFDRELRTIDVIDELAFLFMDLATHSRLDLGYAFLNRCLEITGDYAGLKLLSLYVAHRALIRAKVAAIAGVEGVAADAAGRAGRYLDCAARALAPAPPLLLITSGLSGSGKTFIGRALVPVLPALQIRSDVERKRLHGLAATADATDGIGQGLYGQAATDATYDRLRLAAEAALAGGVNLIVDAAFLERARREALRDLARRHGAHFLLLRCEASEATLRRRIRERAEQRRDASDATEAVLEHQLRTEEPLAPDETGTALTVDTNERVDIGRLAAAIRARA